ncbi:MAG: TetR/AcrR family transcriptional regulator [Thermoanaerobaculia bacterium]
MTHPPRLRTGETFLAEPQQGRSIEKRRRLLRAGRDLFRERGFDATSIEAITSRAGTASGAFYTYFRSKQQLLVVLMNELLERLAAADLRPRSTVVMREGLRRFLAEVFRVDLEYFGVIRAWQEATLTDPQLARMHRAIESWTGARILRVFQALQKSPNARKNGDLPAFARMMDRHLWSLLARGSGLGARDLNREIRIAADVIYHYLFRDS